jgi:hypothetical protein
MNANLQDMLLIVASFLLVLGGVTYWLYTAIEQNQRKIGVLENVLYELRFTIQEKMNQPPSYDNVPHSAQEEEHGEHAEQGEQHEHAQEDEKVVALNREYSEPPESVAGEVINTLKEFDDDLPLERDLDDLRPGGVLDLNEDEILNDWNKKPNKEEKNFKNLFVGSNAPESTPLDAMSLKDLRSMASQRKITGAKNMKRNELVEALRVQLPSVSAVESPQNVIRSLE